MSMMRMLPFASLLSIAEVRSTHTWAVSLDKQASCNVASDYNLPASIDTDGAGGAVVVGKYRGSSLLGASATALTSTFVARVGLSEEWVISMQGTSEAWAISTATNSRCGLVKTLTL